MSSLRWYINRLRAMSAGEIAHRLDEKRKKLISKRDRRGWARFAHAGTDAGVLAAIPGFRTRVQQASPAFRDAVAESSTQICAGRFEALGRAWPQRDPADLFPAEIWRLDPVTQKLWPGAERYTFDIAYRHETALGDIKYVWEFNRLQFLQPLAADVLLNQSQTALAAIEEAIASWHAANPPFRGLAWNSGIELALRAISLLVVGSLCGERLSADSRRRLHEILAAHAVWLARFPSRFSSANNHLVAEAAGEWLIALALPQDPAGSRAQKRAQATLEREALKQILPDGVGAEQSPTYAAFTAEFLLLSQLAGAEAGRSFSQAFADRLARFSFFVQCLAEADGQVPQICDDDEGRVLTLCGPEPSYAVSVAASVGGYLDLPVPVEIKPSLRGAVFGQPPSPPTSTDGLHSFAEGGYSIIRERMGGHEVRLVFDHAPLGYLSIAAHGHADALAVLLSIDGQPVLTDPGTYLYHSGGAWRDWFRSTRAHNTLSLGGQDQSVMAGPFNWSHKAVARLDTVQAQQPYRLVASHDGYVGRFGVRHERTIQQTENGFLLTDRLIGAQSGQLPPAEVTFQLAPDLRAVCDAAKVTVMRDATALMTLHFDDDRLRVERGSDRDGGWVSASFGNKVAADRIVWTGAVDEQGRGVRIEIGDHRQG